MDLSFCHCQFHMVLVISHPLNNLLSLSKQKLCLNLLSMIMSMPILKGRQDYQAYVKDNVNVKCFFELYCKIFNPPVSASSGVGDEAWTCGDEIDGSIPCQSYLFSVELLELSRLRIMTIAMPMSVFIPIISCHKNYLSMTKPMSVSNISSNDVRQFLTSNQPEAVE